MARRTLVSSRNVDLAMTAGVRLTMTASATSSDNRLFAATYSCGDSRFSRTHRFRAEMISGTQTTLSASADVAWQTSSTSWLPFSSTYRLAKAEESHSVFISGRFALFQD